MSKKRGKFTDRKKFFYLGILKGVIENVYTIKRMMKVMMTMKTKTCLILERNSASHCNHSDDATNSLVFNIPLQTMLRVRLQHSGILFVCGRAATTST